MADQSFLPCMVEDEYGLDLDDTPKHTRTVVSSSGHSEKWAKMPYDHQDQLGHLQDLLEELKKVVEDGFRQQQALILRPPSRTQPMPPSETPPTSPRTSQRRRTTGSSFLKAVVRDDVVDLAQSLVPSPSECSKRRPSFVSNDSDTSDGAAPVVRHVSSVMEGVLHSMREDSHHEIASPSFRRRRNSMSGGLQSGWQWRQWLADLLGSTLFEVAFCVLIVFNAALVGLEADMAAREPGGPQTKPLLAMELGVCLVFVLEFIARLLAFGKKMFEREVRVQNCLEAAGGIMALVEVVLLAAQLASDGADSPTIWILRTLGLLRASRITRTFKVFRHLRLIMLSLLTGTRSLLWTLLLLVKVIFIFSVYLSTLVARGVSQGRPLLGLDDLFSSMPNTMLTLFQAISNGKSWDLITAGLQQVSPMAVWVFLAYMCFSIFAVMNIMTGFFVEQAMKAAESDLDNAINEQMEERNRVVANLRDLFREVTGAADGTITWDDLVSHFEDPTILAYFKKLNLELSDVRTFFELAEFRKDSSVNIEHFVRGCVRLKGPAKNADVVVLRHQVEMLSQDITKLLRQQRGSADRASGMGCG